MEKNTWACIGGGGTKRDFSEGRCVQKATTALKQLSLPLRCQRLRSQHVCICLVEDASRHDYAESASLTAGPAAGSMV